MLQDGEYSVYILALCIPTGFPAGFHLLGGGELKDFGGGE